jgi:HAMP domain-containing protein
MLKKTTIGFRLNCMIALLLIVTCAALAAINSVLSHAGMEKEIETRTLPALAAEVVAAVDQQIVAPATTLTAMTAHPMLQDWILQGEDPAKIPLLFQASRNISALHNTSGVNVVLRDSLNYYELSGGKETVKKADPIVDPWFFDFEKSGDPLWVNIYGPTDPHYANLAFINCRIDRNGRFLGIISVGMQVEEFNKRLTSMRVGEKGITFLARKNGEIMLHPDASLNGTPLRALPGFGEYADPALREKKMHFTTRNAAGDKILVATQDIPVLNAVVFSQAQVSELLHDMDMIWLYSAIASLSFLALGITLSSSFVGTITRPLRLIIQYAKDMAAEQSAAPPSMAVSGEMGELLTSVNTMVDSIAKRVYETHEKSEEARLVIYPCNKNQQDAPVTFNLFQ